MNESTLTATWREVFLEDQTLPSILMAVTGQAEEAEVHFREAITSEEVIRVRVDPQSSPRDGNSRV